MHMRKRIRKAPLAAVTLLAAMLMQLTAVFAEQLPSETANSDLPGMATSTNLPGETADPVGKVTDTDQPETVTAVTDIDVEDVHPMTVGSSQMLVVTLIPIGADAKITYSSLRPEIATVNALGRISALQVGEAVIEIKAGEITREISVTITEEAQEDAVAVTSIELNEFSDSLAVGKTQTINALVYPAGANAAITYSSSKPSVAAVSEGGVITGKSSGVTTITVSAGGVSVSEKLTVYVATDNIKTAKSYITLCPGQTYQIKATVEPGGAEQWITYSSTNEAVVTVSDEGLIKAVGVGHASILLENKDAMKAVTVVVNRGGTGHDGVLEDTQAETDAEDVLSLQSLIAGAVERDSVFYVSTENCPWVTKDILMALYRSQETLRIAGADYEMIVSGEKLKNVKNEVDTHLRVKETNRGLEFTVNNGEALPGEVLIVLPDLDESYAYLYIYNENKESFQKLNWKAPNAISVTTAGTYLLTTERLRQSNMPVYVVVSIAGAAIAAAAVYMLTKRKYWFW